jgi:hypothetical protein
MYLLINISHYSCQKNIFLKCPYRNGMVKYLQTNMCERKYMYTESPQLNVCPKGTTLKVMVQNKNQVRHSSFY